MDIDIADLLDFTWIIENEVAASRHPIKATYYDVSWEDVVMWLNKQGIQAIITLSAERPLEIEEIKVLDKFNVSYLFLPITDFSIPDDDSIVERFVSYTSKLRGEKKPFLVHCAAGCGRTGIMLMIYLMEKGMSLNDAFNYIIDRRFCVSMLQDNMLQWNYVNEYAIKKGKI